MIGNKGITDFIIDNRNPCGELIDQYNDYRLIEL